MDNKDTGFLLDKENIELNRFYFEQMAEAIGIHVLYRAPREERKDYDIHGELDADYYEPEGVWVIFEQHPNQSTCKKLGWNSELTEGSILMVVPYDLKKLQTGSLFIIPSAFDNTQGTVWKVLKMNACPVYPASITCELGPKLRSELDKSVVRDYSKSNFNIILEEEEE